MLARGHGSCWASEVGGLSSTENTVSLCVDVPVGDSDEHGFVMWTTAFATLARFSSGPPFGMLCLSDDEMRFGGLPGTMVPDAL